MSTFVLKVATSHCEHRGSMTGHAKVSGLRDASSTVQTLKAEQQQTRDAYGIEGIGSTIALSCSMRKAASALSIASAAIFIHAPHRD
jgi:hypothetical protein